jgi:Ca2+-binding RTX toxin-like protein
MRRRRLPARCLAVAPLLAALGLALVLTAANMVPATNAGQSVRLIGVNDLKPPECSGLALTTLVIGLNGTAGADLQLGTAAGETLNGNGGNDCILGGGGNDTIRGGAGTDVCIGGPGTDTFATCETTYQ